MTTQSVLILTYHFPPSAASGTFRMLGFARHLPRFGWRVKVVAPPEMPWDPVDAALSDQVPLETEYHSVPYPRGTPRLLRLAAPYAVWLPYAWAECRRLLRRERPDIVLTSGPPHVIHLLGLLLKRSVRLPWIADFRDPWISGAIRSRPTPGQRWLRYWERQVMLHADRVLANAPNAGRLFCEAYPRQAVKVVTLTNGFDPPARAQSASPTDSSAIRMLHAGEIYAGRDPLPLLEAMAELKKSPQRPERVLRLEVMGNVHLGGADLGALAARRGLSTDVLVRGQLPYQDALQEIAQSDLLVLLDGPGRKIGVPAKLYEYFGAGRPILALAEPDGDTAHVLRESGVLHRVAPPRDTTRIRQALAELVSEISAGAMVTPDLKCLRRFTRESLAGELARIMDRVVRARDPMAAGPPKITEDGHDAVDDSARRGARQRGSSGRPELAAAARS
jgi:glycosyltransferase involved in cell wall biosynthesis